MKILVSDTSVLIELGHGELLEYAFKCGHQFVVPDLLYDRELADYDGPHLITLGLEVISLTPEEVALAQTVSEMKPLLSMPDCFGLSCATRPDHMLLTGDQRLRNEAEARHVDCRGLLWLLDTILNSGAATETILHAGLTKISGRPRCRLPRDEVVSRLKAWAPNTAAPQL